METGRLNLVLGDANRFPAVVQLYNAERRMGREPYCTIRMNCTQISRIHGILRYDCPRWYLIDTSSNGMKLNEIKMVKYRSYELQDKDKIQILPNASVMYEFTYLNNGVWNPWPDPDEVVILDNSPQPCSSKACMGVMVTPPRRPSVEIIEPSYEYDAADRSRYNWGSLGVPSKRKVGNTRALDSKRKRVKATWDDVAAHDNVSGTVYPPSSRTSSGESDNQARTEALRQRLKSCLEELKSTKTELKNEKSERAREVEEERNKAKGLEESLRAVISAEHGKKVFELVEEQLNCPICSGVYIEATTLECGHTYCNFCINNWLSKKKECPKCRSKVGNGKPLRNFDIDSFTLNLYQSFGEEASRRELILERRIAEARAHAAQEEQRRNAAGQRNTRGFLMVRAPPGTSARSQAVPNFSPPGPPHRTSSIVTIPFRLLPTVPHQPASSTVRMAGHSRPYAGPSIEMLEAASAAVSNAIAEYERSGLMVPVSRGRGRGRRANNTPSAPTPPTARRGRGRAHNSRNSSNGTGANPPTD